jgi:predicted nucleotidyltransferase
MLAGTVRKRLPRIGHTSPYNGLMSQLAVLADDLSVDERTLRRAAAQGALRSERRSPRRLILAPGEAGYLRRHWPLLAALRRALRTEPNVAFALLFGSIARGDDQVDSDVDLIVVLREHSIDGMVELQSRLERTLDRDIDVLSLEAASSNELLLAMAVEEGRVLVDRVGLWARLSDELGDLRRRADRASRRERREALAAIDQFLS